MLGLLWDLDDPLLDDIMAAIRKHEWEVIKYNNDVSTTWRFWRPDDTIMGGATGAYQTTAVAGAATQLISGVSPPAAITVPTAWGIFQIGWYCDVNIQPGSYFQTIINNIRRNEMPAQAVFNHKNHFLPTPRQLILAREQDSIIFQIISAAAVNVTGLLFPFAVIIAPAEQINMMPPPEDVLQERRSRLKSERA